MTEQPRRHYASVPSCADPNQPYVPRAPNNCIDCQKHSIEGTTCHSFPKAQSNMKVPQ